MALPLIRLTILRVLVLGAALAFASAAQALDFRLALPPNAEDLRGSIRGAMLSATAAEDPDAAPQDIIAAAQADYRRIMSALYEEGYFGPEVSIRIDGREAATLSPFEAPARIATLEVKVTPGPRFRFGRAEIAPLPPGVSPRESFRTGERARLSVMRRAARDGITAWRDIGHAKAELSGQRIVAMQPERRLNADLRLAPGPRLRFGRLLVSGAETVSAKRIRKIAGLPEGSVFDPEDLDRAVARLRRTGTFSSVAVTEADTPSPDGTLDVTVQLQENPPRRFGFGAELSSEEGGTVSAYWLHRNLLGGAERFRVGAEISGIGTGTKDDGEDYLVEFRFRRPAVIDSDTDFFAGAGFEVIDDPLFESDKGQILAGLIHTFGDEFEASASLGYRYASTRDDLGSRDFSQIILPVTAKLDRRDDFLDPARGYYLNVETMPFAGLNGTESGLRLTADARAYRALGEDDRVVLAGRLQFGSVMGPDITEVMPEDLFYLGGGGTVRGQDYQSLGVTLPGGEEVGGRSFLALSAEVRAKLRGAFGVVGFYDRGYVSDESFPDGGSANQAGAGIGLRYDTGIGPIRVDLAVPTTGPKAGEDIFFYIGIGQAF